MPASTSRVDPRDGDLSVRSHRHFHYRGDVAEKTPVRRDPIRGLVSRFCPQPDCSAASSTTLRKRRGSTGYCSIGPIFG